MKQAMFHFAETIRISPDYVETYNKIGMILAEQGKYYKAKVFFSRALQLDPGFSEARTNLDILRNSRMSK
jgi:lipoprotein NlpI